MIAIIAVAVFLSVYSSVYKVYLYRRMHLSLVMVKGPSYLEERKGPFLIFKEKVLDRIISSFGFIERLSAVRWLAGPFVLSRLIRAGSPLSILEFILVRILSLAFFLILGGTAFPQERILFIAGGLVVGYFAPELWLGSKIKRRQKEIRRDLPAVIDLLSLCVNAGLDFMLALNRMLRDFKKCALTKEFSEVWQEIHMGASRRDALQHFSRRVNLPEISSFVRTLLQADRMGSPMGAALKIQAEEVRQRRYLAGEEMALKAPIKLLFPLFAFILPAVLIVVAGPIFLQFMQGGMKF